MLLDPDHIKGVEWSQERAFWRTQILPLVETNYWRSLDDSGQLTDLKLENRHPFQLLFLDILLRTLRLNGATPPFAGGMPCCVGGLIYPC